MTHVKAVRTVARILAATTLAALTVAATAQTPRYSVRNLGTLLQTAENDYADAISSDGTKVVGHAVAVVNRQQVTHAFYWDGTMHDIGVRTMAPRYVTSSGLVLLPYTNAAPYGVWSLATGTVALPTPGGLVGTPQSMNNAALVAGGSRNPGAFLGNDAYGTAIYAWIGLRWERNGAGQWGYTQLYPLAGHNSSRAFHIDQNGNMIGYSAVDSVSGSADTHVALWSPSDGFVPHDLGLLPAQSSVIAFRTDPVTLATQFIVSGGASQSWYSNGITTTELRATDTVNPGSAANGLTSAGQVAGTGKFSGKTRAYYWDTTFPSGAVSDLGALPGMSNSAVPNARIATMNEAGFIVGFSYPVYSIDARAFVSTPASRATSAKLLDLNTLLSNTLSSAGLSSLAGGYAVNDAGFILCNANAVKLPGGTYQRVAILTRVQ